MLRYLLLSLIGTPVLAAIRIFVYTSQDAPAIETLTNCYTHLEAHTNGQWGMEVRIHRWLLRSELRTTAPADADFFFVPSYAKCLDDHQLMDIQALNATFTDLVAQLAYFKKSGGRDHVWVFPSGRGPTLFLGWRQLLPDSIFLVPEPHFSDGQAGMAPYFHAHRDVLVPGHIRAERISSLLTKRQPVEERRWLIGYKGAVQGKPGRIQIGQLAQRFPGELTTGGDYEALMTGSRFCLIPRGQSAWTRRAFEAFFAECIPVVLSDHWEMPFEARFNYSRVTIKWPADQIDDTLVHYLRSVSLDAIRAAQERMRAIRCMFEYSRPFGQCSPYDGIVHALESKRSAFRHGYAEEYSLV